MKLLKNQRGFAVFETILLLAIVAIIAFAGYKVFSTKQSIDETDANISASQPINNSKTESPEQIKNVGDLNKTEQALNNLNPEDTSADTTQLDNQLSSF